MGPNELDWFEAALTAVADAGVTERETFQVVLLINAYVRGDAVGAAEAAGGRSGRMGVPPCQGS